MSQDERADAFAKADDDVSPIKGFMAFYVYWSIPLGILLTLISTVSSFDVDDYDSKFLLAYDIIYPAVYMMSCLYVMVAFIRRRTDAVFMAKWQLGLLLFGNILVVACGEAEIPVVTGMIWAVIFFVYLSLSESVKDRIPVETRRLTKFSKVFLSTSVGALVLSLLGGVVETLTGFEIFAGPEEKIESLCEIASAMLPDGDLHDIYVEENSVVYVMDMEWGELTQTSIDRMAISFREVLLDELELDADTEEFFDLCIEADYSITYKYTDASALTCVTVVVPPDQLYMAMQPYYVHTVSSDTWDTVLEMYNSELPRLYFQDCNLDEVTVDDELNRIIFDLNLTNISVYSLTALTIDDIESHMRSLFAALSDDVMALAEISGYDVVYNFTADCLPSWSMSVLLAHDEIFYDEISY